jgi:DNA adenine methylase
MMVPQLLPKSIDRTYVPPIKCQGIKTKLIPFIADNIKWDGNGRWIEPFLGSGVVALNIQPNSAILSDTNRHIIQFYKDIQDKKIDEQITRDYLALMGAELEKKGEPFYYEIRAKFNADGGSLPFLFLNRSCFNGMMRFNSKGGYNVPFGHKPKRFSKAYITKITNQVLFVRKLLLYKDWEFRVCDWRDALNQVKSTDFVYLDPPYVGRHTDYYNNWTEKDAVDLAKKTHLLPGGYALSMWKENIFRKNYYIDDYWNAQEIRTFSHFYHVGSIEKYRNEILEALIIHPDFVTEPVISFKKKLPEKEILQPLLFQ